MANDFVYSTSDGRKSAKLLRQLKAFTHSIVVKRKAELITQRKLGGENKNAFQSNQTNLLDLLLGYHLDGQLLTESDCCTLLVYWVVA